MLKVSFKDNFKKVQVFNDKVTTVTLTGIMQCPDFIDDCLPTSVYNWINEHPSVEVSVTYTTNKGLCYIIIVSGKSVCTEGDTFDAKMGERIAESKAKIRLYDFMRTLCLKLMGYYQNILYGSPNTGSIAIRDNSGGLEAVTNKYINLCHTECRHLAKLLKGI